MTNALFGGGLHPGSGSYPGLCAAGRQVQGVIALNNNKNSTDLDKQ
jgi:hypothetical protein